MVLRRSDPEVPLDPPVPLLPVLPVLPVAPVAGLALDRQQHAHGGGA